jgi:hypothetical protein
MTRIRKLLPLLGAAGLVLGLGCSDSSGPGSGGGPLPPDSLHILMLAPGHLPFYQDSVSFWASTLEDRQGAIRFQDSQGGPGEDFVRLKVDKEALLTRPDGTPFVAGDSIEITIKATGDSVLFDFQPSGLKFNPLHPAELKVEYGHAGGTGGEGDYNDDGVVNAQDTTVENQLAVWVQEVLGGNFTQLASIRIEEFNEIEASVLGFSRYAVSY